MTVQSREEHTLSSHNKPRTLWPIVLIVIIMVLIGLSLVFLMPNQNTTNSGLGNTNVTVKLEKQAAELRSQLPKKMNETVTANDVTVNEDTIIYDMALTPDVDESKLNNQSLKDPLVGPLCLNQDSRALLDVGATFRYDYTHSGSGGVYKVAITKYDC